MHLCWPTAVTQWDEQLTIYPKVKGLTPAANADTRRKKMAKACYVLARLIFVSKARAYQSTYTLLDSTHVQKCKQACLFENEEKKVFEQKMYNLFTTKVW